MSAEHPNQIEWSSERYLDDLEFTANLVGAHFEREACSRIVDLYRGDFQKNVLQWKVTDLEGDGLYFRFLSTDQIDQVRKAAEARLVNCTDSRLHGLQQNVIDFIPGAVRSGVDFEAQGRLSKVWTFTTPIPVSVALRIEGLPPALLAREEMFTKLGFDGVGFVATDFIRNCMTMYFGWIISPVNSVWLDRVAECTGTEGISESVKAQILRSANELRGVSMTFNWEQDAVLRWGLYRFGVPFGDAEVGNLPVLSSRLRMLVERAPSLNYEPCYHFAWSFGRPQNYLKLEKNYSRDVHYFLKKERGITL